jgi:integrase
MTLEAAPLKVERNFPYTCCDVDRHGNTRTFVRLRVGGVMRKTRLRNSLATAEGEAEYRAALAAMALAAKGEAPTAAAAPKPDTWRWLCHQHFHSANWKQLDPASQRAWRRHAESTWIEPINPDSALLVGDCPPKKITSKLVRMLVERKSDYPHAANDRLKVIKRILSWAVENEYLETNPARDVKRLKTPPGGHHSVTDEEIAQYRERHAVGTKARMAFELALWTGLRREDLTRVGPGHVRDGWLMLTLAKNEGRNPVDVEIPISRELQEVIDLTPRPVRHDGAENLRAPFLLTEAGKPFAVAGFGNWFRERFNQAGLKECSAHGLRKACARMWAEDGRSAKDLMTWFGWLSGKEAEYYTRAASKRKITERMAASRGKDGT